MTYRRQDHAFKARLAEIADARTRIAIREQMVIDECGNILMVDSALASAVGDALGFSKVARASHVIPANPFLKAIFNLLRTLSTDDSPLTEWTRTWKCEWIVDTRPVGGRILRGGWKTRQDAIDAEIEYLNQLFAR